MAMEIARLMQRKKKKSPFRQEIHVNVEMIEFEVQQRVFATALTVVTKASNKGNSLLPFSA